MDKQTALVLRKAEVTSFMAPHEDIAPLMWWADGPYKNYKKCDDILTFNLGGHSYTLNLSQRAEPSLVFTELPIQIDVSATSTERPPYYPRYADLTNEQRGVYWQFLRNPYCGSFEIGYVFLFYYGLERHLLCGNAEAAFDVILKLRESYPNESFQTYSAHAIIISCLIRRRADLLQRFIDSLTQNHEFSFSSNLYLLCLYGLDMSITSRDIIRMAKALKFTNMNYIKKYPDLFKTSLEDEMLMRFNTSTLWIRDLVTSSDWFNTRQKSEVAFANVSISERWFDLPQLTEFSCFQSEMKGLLMNAHSSVKTKLAAKRKAEKKLHS